MGQIDIECGIDYESDESSAFDVRLNHHEDVDVGIRPRVAARDRAEKSEVDKISLQSGAQNGCEFRDRSLPRVAASTRSSAVEDRGLIERRNYRTTRDLSCHGRRASLSRAGNVRSARFRGFNSSTQRDVTA